MYYLVAESPTAVLTKSLTHSVIHRSNFASFSCTDVEASKEVSKISDQLISIATSIENEEHDEDVDGIIEFSIIRRELFANV